MIGLLYKYDCPAWLAIFRTSVRLASARMTGTHDAHDLFKLSAALSDPIGCSEALPAAAELTWADDCHTNAAGDKAKMDQNITDKSVLDVAGMCEDELTELPLAYIGALARGWTKRGLSSKADWHAVAAEFYRALTGCVTFSSSPSIVSEHAIDLCPQSLADKQSNGIESEPSIRL